jgi:hypothetical protein
MREQIYSSLLINKVYLLYLAKEKVLSYISTFPEYGPTGAQ